VRRVAWAAAGDRERAQAQTPGGAVFILSFIRSLYKTLSADASPSAIAFAVAFGTLAGCVPATSRIALFLFLLIVVVRVQISAAILTWGLVRLASVAGMASLFNPVGEAILETAALRPFWTWALNLPVIAWLGLEYHAIMGGVAVGLVLGLALFFPVKLLVIAYRQWAQEKLESNKFFRWLVNFWVIKALRFVFVGRS
jgi:uncharacterized protein (TIGR03546 family)